MRCRQEAKNADYSPYFAPWCNEIVGAAKRRPVNVVRMTSVAVILNSRGERLDLGALDDIPMAHVVRADFTHGDLAVCVAATLEHACSLAELQTALRPWAAGRGWSITVAPSPSPS